MKLGWPFQRRAPWPPRAEPPPTGAGDPATTDLVLGRARVRFAGYSRKRLKRILRKFDNEVRERPEVVELSGVIFQPGGRCLYDAAGNRIEATRLRWIDPDAVDTESRQSKYAGREEREEPTPIVPPADPIRITEPHAYLGEVKQHYGHFLTDGLSRAWLTDELAHDHKALFLRANFASTQTPHVVWALEQLGLSDRVRILREPILFDRVICPLPAIQQSNRVYDVFDRPHRRVAMSAIEARRLKPFGKPVYLSRRGLGDGYRAIRREDALEDRLEREGFAIVSPERLSIDEQIMLFNQDQPVVGLTGSAMHTALFRVEPGGARCVITPEDVSGRFPLIDMIKGGQALYINGLTEITEAEAPMLMGLQERSWEIDVDLVLSHLDAAGFLGARRRRI